MKLAIVGLGFIGAAVARLFGRHELVTYDVVTAEPYPGDAIADCDWAFVCVDTPSLPDGRCDLSQVHEAFRMLTASRVVLKSTVPPSTSDALARLYSKEVCFWPEYISPSPYNEPYWRNDMQEVPFAILGGAPRVRRQLIADLTPVLGPSRVIYQCSALEAELIKYMENAFLACKISFVNEFASIVDAFGDADWNTVREGWLLDPRIGRSHTAVFQAEPGFGGHCLPKDLSAIICAAAEAGYVPELLREVEATNRRMRSANDE